MNSSPPGHRTRVPFTTEDDALLVKYIAKYNPALRGRLGNALYKTLVDNVRPGLIQYSYKLLNKRVFLGR